jgi:hypothetical protein
MKTLMTHTAMFLMFGCILLSCSYSSQGTSSTSTSAFDTAKDNSAQIREAIVHAREAEKYGTRGDAQELVAHAEAALKFSKQAQKSQPVREHLREATEALGQAIEEGRKGDAATAAQRVHQAILELLQAEDAQASPTSQPASDTGK